MEWQGSVTSIGPRVTPTSRLRMKHSCHAPRILVVEAVVADEILGQDIRHSRAVALFGGGLQGFDLPAQRLLRRLAAATRNDCQSQH